MKKALVIIVILIVSGYWGSVLYGNVLLHQSSKHLSISPKRIVEKEHIAVAETKTLFVPYWTMSSPLQHEGYTHLVYFGIVPDIQGISKTDQGYRNLSSFISQVPPHTALLAVRMTDKTINNEVLDSPSLQQRIISDAIVIATKNGFSGIVLDLEISGIGFDSITKKVTAFISTFSRAVHKENLTFSPTIYSDAFYRGRPYDVKAIASVSDSLFVMAYDFHKAGGDPGPNFPFAESNADSYTFPQMIDDFTKDIPREKLTIVFGMFGYDWPVTERGDSVDTAIALTNKEIEKNFIDSCAYTSCLLKRNVSDEPSISYTDHDHQVHLIWFEDQKSAQKKIDFLRSKGIGSIAFWANSYF